MKGAGRVATIITYSVLLVVDETKIADFTPLKLIEDCFNCSQAESIIEHVKSTEMQRYGEVR